MGPSSNDVLITDTYKGIGSKSDPIIIGDGTTPDVTYAHRILKKRKHDCVYLGEAREDTPSTPPAKRVCLHEKTMGSRNVSTNKPTEQGITLKSALKKQGLFQIPIAEDGQCCYHSMTTSANLHALLSKQTTKKIDHRDIIKHLQSCVTTLLEHIETNQQLTEEVIDLLETDASQASAKKALISMRDRFEHFVAGDVTIFNAHFWGDSSMFGLLGLVYGFKVARYVLSTSSINAIKKGDPAKKATSLCQVPDFDRYPEIQHILEDKIKGAATDASYIIACHDLTPGSPHPVNHFDVWLTKEQTHSANTQLDALKTRSVSSLSSYLSWLAGLPLAAAALLWKREDSPTSSTDITTRKIQAWLRK